MIIRKCDRCGEDISILSYTIKVTDTMMQRENQGTTGTVRSMHLCGDCKSKLDELLIKFQLYFRKMVSKQPVDY